jgi:signal transduction histidine kinase
MMKDRDLPGRALRALRPPPGQGPEPAWPGSVASWAVDVVIAAAVTLFEVYVSQEADSWNPHMRHQAPPGVLALVLLGLGGAALLARRRYPVAVLLITLVSAIWAMELGAKLVWFTVIVAFLTAVLARQRAAAIGSLIIGYVASVWPPWLIGQRNHTSVEFALVLAGGLVFLLVVAELIRIRSQRGAALERSRAEELRRRASEDRLQMARDLHDVVAHNIAVINVQANTALHLMDRQPERAAAALATINDVSKQALVELRSVLGVLRDVDSGGVTGAPRAPAPGLDRLGDLVDNAAAAGLAVHVEEDGQPAALPADVDLTAYRIIQEALTNSARHSGGSTATVRLGYGDGALLVEVDDDGTPGPARPARPAPAAANGSGHGIAGMTERAAALGGSLEAGPLPQGGFGVRARLPLQRGAE